MGAVTWENVSTVVDDTTTAILDATRAAVLDFGIRRTTLTDVARRAGVSRMTVYRRYPDVDALLRELMTREFSELLLAIDADVEGPNGRVRLVNALVAGVPALREQPLFQKVLAAEPELLIPYVFVRMGGTQHAGLALIEREVAAGQQDGSIRAGDPRVLAQAILLVVQSFVLSAGIVQGVALRPLLAELERLLEAALAP
jgi:AcrR family transcriptional regulator